MTNPTANRPIVILGAGIVGLDVALVLAEKGFGRNIAIVAEYLPGDTAPDYTSPWAGCNFSAISGTDANALKWDRQCYAHLAKLATNQPDKAYVKRTPSIEYWDADGYVPHDKIDSMADYLEDFKVLPRSSLPKGVSFGVSFTTFSVNAPKHLVYLATRLRDDYGVVFIRQKLASVHAPFAQSRTMLVFNCVGNAARTLPGVEDASCFPTRGQVVLVKAPHVRTNMMRHGKDYETYLIPRPQSDGHVILGGFMQKGNNDAATYGHEVESILSRTIGLSAELRDNKFEQIIALSGRRPSRKGGARIERGSVVVGDREMPVIHNYGAGGTGFQAGYGMATDAVSLAKDVLTEIHSGPF